MGKSEANSQDSNLERSETDKTLLATLQGIRIAILGPGLGGPSEPGLHKRVKIRKVLQADGHEPFFPEDDGVLVSDNPLEPLLEQERRLLISPDVQLIIVLHTSNSIGVISELSYFMNIPEIRAKTAVLVPSEFYTPNESLFANTVREYFVKLPYTDYHFRVCQLVDECRRWARDVQVGNWPGLVPFQA